MGYYSTIEKNEIWPFVTTWVVLEGIMLSEISQTERQILYDFTCVWNLKNKINEQTKQKQTHRYREQINGRQLGRDWRDG